MNGFWNKLRRSKDLTAIGLSDTVGGVIVGIFWFYIASLIEPAEYGKLSFYIGIAGLTQSISLIVTTNVITVYTAKNVKIQSSFFLLDIIAGIVTSSILIVVLSRVDVGLLVFGFIIFNLATPILVGRKQYTKYMKYVLIQKILTLVLGTTFYFIFGVNGIIMALVISFIHFIPIIHKEFRVTKIDFTLLIKSRKFFMINNYFVNLTSGFRRDVDKLIIPSIVGFSLLGNYALAIQIIMIMMILPTTIYKYILPHDSSGVSKIRLKKLTVLMSLIISILGIFSTPIILQNFFPKYLGSIEAIQIMSISIVPGTISLLYTSKFLGSESSRPLLISTITQFVIITVGIITLSPIFGMVGLAVTYVLSSVAQCVSLILSNKILKTKPNS